MRDDEDKGLLYIGWVILGVFLLLFVTQPAEASDENGDRYCLALNIYHEAANQSFAGQVAVSNVVMNRVDDLQFPNTICEVVYQAKMKENWKGNLVPIKHQCQFSWFCDGKPDEPVDSITWVKSIRVADAVLNGDYPDITEGSLWYHADFVYPYWADDLERVTTIDNHLFYK